MGATASTHCSGICDKCLDISHHYVYKDSCSTKQKGTVCNGICGMCDGDCKGRSVSEYTFRSKYSVIIFLLIVIKIIMFLFKFINKISAKI